jgi:pyruvate/2-oxoglutarate/acetoin dehydrogenase E1 component
VPGSEGSDVTVVAVGHVVHDALAVADELEREGISVEVSDPRTLLPLDRELLAVSVAKTRRIAIFDDSNRTCGYAAEVAAVVVEDLWDELRAPVSGSRGRTLRTASRCHSSTSWFRRPRGSRMPSGRLPLGSKGIR